MRNNTARYNHNNSLQCPVCNAPEEHENGMWVHIRAYKVEARGYWYSQCLVCSGGYDKINGTFSKERHNEAKGWF